jgi:hypothetical protein
LIAALPAGLKTLNLLRAAATLAFVATAIGLAAEHSQLPTEQAKTLELIRTTALAYSHSLPDFICRQVTHREAVSLKAMAAFPDGWNSGGNARLPITTSVGPGDVIEEQLTFINQREEYKVLTVDGKKAAALDHAGLRGMISAGEFGSALHEIFDPLSKATFTWGRREKVRSREVYVLGFQVPAEHGARFKFGGAAKETLISYRGQVFVDAGNLDVLRIRSALDLPADSPWKKGESMVEYERTEIAGKSYNLPFHSEVTLQDKDVAYSNRIDFRDYHKFAVESTIHFNDPQ